MPPEDVDGEHKVNIVLPERKRIEAAIAAIGKRLGIRGSAQTNGGGGVLPWKGSKAQEGESYFRRWSCSNQGRATEAVGGEEKVRM